MVGLVSKCGGELVNNSQKRKRRQNFYTRLKKCGILWVVSYRIPPIIHFVGFLCKGREGGREGREEKGRQGNPIGYHP